MARNLIDIIKGIFDSESATETESGQRVIGFDAILPEIEGLKLLDEEDVTGEKTEDEVEETTVTTVEETVQYVSADELTDVINRLVALEQLIRVDETIDTNVEHPIVERW